MDIERQTFMSELDKELNGSSELKEHGFVNTKWIGSKEDFKAMATALGIKFGTIQKEGKFLQYRMFILGTIGGVDVFEVRFVKMLEGETLEQTAIRSGIPIKVN